MCLRCLGDRRESRMVPRVETESDSRSHRAHDLLAIHLRAERVCDIRRDANGVDTIRAVCARGETRGLLAIGTRSALSVDETVKDQRVRDDLARSPPQSATFPTAEFLRSPTSLSLMMCSRPGIPDLLSRACSPMFFQFRVSMTVWRKLDFIVKQGKFGTSERHLEWLRKQVQSHSFIRHHASDCNHRLPFCSISHRKTVAACERN